MFRLRLSRPDELDAERVFRTGFIGEMQFRQLAARIGESTKFGGERNAREILRKIVGEALAICRCMQDTVDVIENSVLGNPIVAVPNPEGAKRRVGDVVEAFRRRSQPGKALLAGLALEAVSRETLARFFYEMQIRHDIHHESSKGSS